MEETHEAMKQTTETKEKDAKASPPKTDSPHWIMLFTILFALVGIFGAVFGQSSPDPLGPARLLSSPPETPSAAWQALSGCRTTQGQAEQGEQPLSKLPLTDVDWRDVLYHGYTSLAERIRKTNETGPLRIMVDLDRHLLQVMQQDRLLKSYVCTLDRPDTGMLRRYMAQAPVFIVAKRMSEPMDVLVLRSARREGVPEEKTLLSAIHGQAGLRLQDGSCFVKDWTENSIALLDWDYQDLAQNIPVGTPVVLLGSQRTEE